MITATTEMIDPNEDIWFHPKKASG